MARWSATIPTWTPVAVADTANMTDAGHQTIQGGSSTQRGTVRDILITGQVASTSSPCILLFGRTSTVGATLTALRLAALDASVAALAAPPVNYAASTTKPQRSATLGALLNMSFNAMGGIIRWQAQRADEAISLLGNTASFGELSLNAFTGGTPGLLGSSIIFEI